MISLLIAFLFAVSIKAATPPPFTPYELDASAIGYMVNASYCQTFGPACVDSIFIVDTPHQRVLFDLGPFGKFAYLPNGVYLYNDSNRPGRCFRMNGRNYTTERNGYRRALQLSDTIVGPHYFGYIDVSDACGRIESFEAFMFGNIVRKQAWSVRIVVPLEPPFYCVDYTAEMISDLTTVKYIFNRDQYFVLPPECSNPEDYCTNFYPEGVCGCGVSM